MKLNNKGFAISTIMYMILVMTIILIILTLSILSSRKLILDKIKSEVMSNIYENQESRLPLEYQEVEYIESTGTQFIDTGFIPNQDTRVVVDYQYTTITNTFLFGTRKSKTSNAYTVNVANYSTDAVTSYGTSGNVVYAAPDSQRHIIDKNKNIFSLDGKVLLTQLEQTFTAPGSLEIFAAYNNGTKGYLPCSAKLYSFKIYDNDELVRDFIPCYRIEDSVIGLYDIVGNEFYINEGEGIFVKGNDVIIN